MSLKGCTTILSYNLPVHPMPDAYVKHLRHNQTPAEARLWFQLRRKRITGRAFRRQHRLDRYIVDFVCLSARLVIEVDGPPTTSRFAKTRSAPAASKPKATGCCASPTPRS
jgi:very-short-patch-repair endonuclease